MQNAGYPQFSSQENLIFIDLYIYIDTYKYKYSIYEQIILYMYNYIIYV